MKNRSKSVVFFIIGAVLSCICVIRIKYINETKSQIDMIYSLNEHIVLNGVGADVNSWDLLSSKEFCEKYKCKESTLADKYVIVEFTLTNETNGDLYIENVIEPFAGVGFEAGAWGSSHDFYLMSQINAYDFQILRTKQTIKYVSCVGVNKTAFSARDWKRIDATEFYYVISLGERPRKVRLGTHKKDN